MCGDGVLDPPNIPTQVKLEWLAVDCSLSPASLSVEINGSSFFNQVADPYSSCSIDPNYRQFQIESNNIIVDAVHMTLLVIPSGVAP